LRPFRPLPLTFRPPPNLSFRASPDSFQPGRRGICCPLRRHRSAIRAREQAVRIALPNLVAETKISSMLRAIPILIACLLALQAASTSPPARGEVVSFPSGNLKLYGLLYKPDGAGPFPAVVYNHGSAAGMASQQAFEALGPVFVKRGWVFFGPYRRGQGLSAAAGPYIEDRSTVHTRKAAFPRLTQLRLDFWKQIT
jgi:hypothetical protein